MSIGLAIGTQLGRVGRVAQTVASDTFTGADGTALASHSPEIGAGWTRSATASDGAGDPLISGGRIYNPTSNIRVYYITGLDLADCEVSADVVLRTDTNNASSGVVGRHNFGAITFYLARYNDTVNAFQLHKYVAGVATQLGSDAAATLTADQAYRLTLAMRGSSIRLLVDGLLAVSVTDTAITAAGKAGVRLGGTASTTTGTHLDNFRVTA